VCQKMWCEQLRSRTLKFSSHGFEDDWLSTQPT
jgi:hypothetical protein